MAGRVFNVASAVSLVLFLVTGGLCAWSYVRPTTWPMGVWSRGTTGYIRELGLGDGRIAVSTLETPAPTTKPAGGYPIGTDVGGWNVMCVSWSYAHMTLLRSDRSVVAVLNTLSTFTLSLGMPLALSAVLPAWWARRRWKVGRVRRAGTCRVCGYDLRASAGRCPECGTGFGADAG